MDLPQNDNILISVINTKLRNNYVDLDDLCLAEGYDYGKLCSRMASLGYCYDEKENAFKKSDIPHP